MVRAGVPGGVVRRVLPLELRRPRLRVGSVTTVVDVPGVGVGVGVEFGVGVGVGLGMMSKVAMTVVSVVGVTVHDPVPEHTPPLHPANVEPVDADAVRVILPDTASEQSDPQEIPVPDTVPVPDPILVTDIRLVVGVVSPSSMTEYVEKPGTEKMRVPLVYEMKVHPAQTLPSLSILGEVMLRP